VFLCYDGSGGDADMKMDRLIGILTILMQKEKTTIFYGGFLSHT